MQDEGGEEVDLRVEHTHYGTLEARVLALYGTREYGKPHVTVLKDPVVVVVGGYSLSCGLKITGLKPL